MDNTIVVVWLVLLMLVALVGAGFSVWYMIHMIRRLVYRAQYHDFLFEPVSHMDLRRVTANFFDKHTPDFLALGFELIGDFRLQPNPCPVLARFFVSRDRRVFASIEDYDGLRACCCSSVLEDGTYVECGTVRGTPVHGGTSGQLHLFPLPKASVQALYAQHCETLAQFEADLGCAVAEFDPDQAGEVANYGHRLLRWDLHNEGLGFQAPTPRQEEELVEVS